MTENVHGLEQIGDQMKKFVFLTYGFEKPTPEVMAAWNGWFASVKDNIVEMIGLGAGKEISEAGTADLPLGPESITGVMVVRAESLDAAQRLAQGNPYGTSIRIYETRSG